MIERTTVRLPSDLLDKARRKAAEENRTLTALIEEGLRVVVAEKKGKPRPAGPLPVSSATGGFQAGIQRHELFRNGGARRPRIHRAPQSWLQMTLPDVNVLIYAFRQDSPTTLCAGCGWSARCEA